MRRLLLRLVLPPLALGVLAAPAIASPWTGPARFVAAQPAPDNLGSAAPRLGLASDGTAVVAYRTLTPGSQDRPVLVAASGGRRGRFGAPHGLTRSPLSSVSAAARRGGDRLVAWVQQDGVRAAVRHRGRWRIRRVSTGRRSAIDDIQVAADPRGGWVVVVSRFVKRTPGVEAVDLRADGRPSGPLVDLGLGDFGNEARPVFALAVDDRGTAHFAYAAIGTAVRSRPHGGRWTVPQLLPGVVDARLTPIDEGGATLTGTQAVRSGDAGSFGGPVVAKLSRAGELGPLVAPELRYPGRAFGPSAVSLRNGRTLVLFNLRDGPSAFSPVAPAAALGLRADGTPGAVRSLTTRETSEPVVVPLAGGRGVALWAGARGWGAQLASSNGRLRPVAPPPGPPAFRFHFNSTNRDIRSAGRLVGLAWERGGRVRVSLRAFGG